MGTQDTGNQGQPNQPGRPGQAQPNRPGQDQPNKPGETRPHDPKQDQDMDDDNRGGGQKGTQKQGGIHRPDRGHAREKQRGA